MGQRADDTGAMNAVRSAAGGAARASWQAPGLSSTSHPYPRVSMVRSEGSLFEARSIATPAGETAQSQSTSWRSEGKAAELASSRAASSPSSRWPNTGRGAGGS